MDSDPPLSRASRRDFIIAFLGPAVRTVTVNTRSLHLYEGSLRRTIPSLLHPQSTAPNLRLACSCEMQTYG